MTVHTTSTRRSFLLLAGSGLVLSGCSTSSVLTPMPGTHDETQAALPMVNKIRQAQGLPALTLDAQARKAAASQAARMAQADKMKHNISFGDDFGSRMIKNEVKLPASENIASGQTTVSAAVQAWIDSPKHLENMLGNYRGLGVAMARAADNRPYWAMVLSG